MKLKLQNVQIPIHPLYTCLKCIYITFTAKTLEVNRANKVLTLSGKGQTGSKVTGSATHTVYKINLLMYFLFKHICAVLTLKSVEIIPKSVKTC